MKFSLCATKIILAAMLTTACAPSQAATFSFSGPNGNFGGPEDSGPPFAFGTLPAGFSSFDVICYDDIPYPSAGPNLAGNLFTFSLASKADVTFTLAPGLYTIIFYGDINYSRFTNPLFKYWPPIVDYYGPANIPPPNQPNILSAVLAPGDYEMAAYVYRPIQPLGTPHIYSLTYSGSVQVSSVVPEPATWVLMLAGLAGLGVAGANRDRHKARASAGA